MLEFFPGVVIEGSRQVGKSTLANEGSAPDALITTLDDTAMRDAAATDPAGSISQAGDRQMVIDEIQRLPELTLTVKASIDRDRRPGRFILTGSSSLLRAKGTADSLAGRVGRVTMYGLSRGEASEIPDDFVSAVSSSVSELPLFTTRTSRNDYAGFLGTGSYPEVRTMTSRIRGQWIDSYLRGVVGRDMSELNRRLEPARVMSLLRAVAGQPAGELAKARLAQDAGIPATTITGYLDLLHDVGLVTSIAPCTPNLTKRETGRAKAFVTDSAVALRLARMSPEQLTDIRYSESFGLFLEAFVGAELLKQQGWSSTDFEVFHYRDRNDDEVDVIIELADGSVIGIEVKAATSFNAKQFKGLKRMRDRLGDRFIAGIVLNTGKSGYRFADRLYGAPISALWEFPRPVNDYRGETAAESVRAERDAR